MGALLALPSGAQEVDVTSYIQNAGFDEDLTFQADGSMKSIISTTTSLSDRSWAYIATDSSVYAKPKSTSSQNRNDGRKLEATNGFIGKVGGWTLETNKEFPQCEWVYFGTIPYSLGETAIPVADDGSTFLTVPAKPEADNGDDNIGFVYMRAGWGGRAVYKQTVKLPCAQYRLEYWAININPNGTNGKNLSKVVCRRDTWEDETGFSNQQWTKHTIEFTPTAEFTMQFGFESSGGSGSNPFLCIDGIRLYKIGEADPVELAQSDLLGIIEDLRAKAEELEEKGLTQAAADLIAEAENAEVYATSDNVELMTMLFNQFKALLEEIDTNVAFIETILTKATNAENAGLITVSSELTDAANAVKELLTSTDAEAKAAAIRYAQVLMESADDVLTDLGNIRRTITHLRTRLDQTNYPGKSEAEAAYSTLSSYLTNGTIGQLLDAKEEALTALRNYVFSQEVTVGQPIDVTYIIGNPWFINEELEPTFEEGKWVFANAESYVQGQSNEDLTMGGWISWRNTWAASYDMRTNWQQGRSCWNAWMKTDTVYREAIVNYLGNMPEGYYTVSADLITQEGCATNQHVFASTVGDYQLSNDDYPCVKSDPLTVGNWVDDGEGEWTTLTTPYIYVDSEGDLTFGAKGQHNVGDENQSAGWFLATNFRLMYYGTEDPTIPHVEPVDMTDRIVNPTFDDNNYDGWLGTRFSGYNAVENAEHYEKNYTTYQTISDMPAGVYALSVNAFYRDGDPANALQRFEEGNFNKIAMLFAGNEQKTYEKAIMSIAEGAVEENYTAPGETYVELTTKNGGTVYLPNDMAAAEYMMHTVGKYKNNLMFHFNGGDLTIGVRKNLLFNQDWSLFDDFALAYYGTGAEAYQLWYYTEKQAAPRFDEFDTECSPQYLTAYNNVLSDLKVVSNYDECTEALNEMVAAYAALTENIQLWKDYENLLLEAQDIVDDPDFTFTEDLNSYLNTGDISGQDATNEQLTEELTNLKALIAEAKQHVEEGSDVTAQYLTNPDFATNNWTGWTVEAASGGNVAVANSCAEAWNNRQFDIYQEVENVPAGVYEISVQGFYRYMRGDDAWNAWQAQESPYVKQSPVYIYLNAKETPFMNIFSEAITDESIFTNSGYNTFVNAQTSETFYAPNNMATAADAFATESNMNEGELMFTQKAYGFVAEGQSMRIGVKGASNQNNDSWVIFDNFKLTYKGMDPTVIKPMLETELASAKECLDDIMGKNAYDSLQTVIAEAEAAIAANDGDRMFAMISVILDVRNNVVNPSALRVNEFSLALSQLGAVIEESSNAVAIEEASAFITDQNEKIFNHGIDENEIDALIEQVAIFRTLLFLPLDYAEASYDYPVDMTSVIINPEFTGNTIEGWNVEGNYNYGNDEVQRSAQALEFWNTTFDINQTIFGLPQGWYQVRVNAFNRTGEDFESLNTDGTYDAYLYGNDNSKAVKYRSNAPSIAEATNNMVSSVEAFENGYYENRLNVYVGEDGKLNLGMRKVNRVYDDWVIMDNWKLIYTGEDEYPDSVDEPDALITIVDDQVIEWTNPDYHPSVKITQTQIGDLSDYKYGSLMLTGDVSATFGQFTTVYDENIDLIQRYIRGNDGSYFASFVNELDEATAANVTIEYWCYTDRWHFFCLPFDVKVSDIGLAFDDTPFVIRRYDGEARAAGKMNETWVNVGADETLHAGQGYIIHSGRYDTSRYPYNGFYFNSNGNNGLFFANYFVNVELNANESTKESNAGWNLIGNPYPAFFSIAGLQTESIGTSYMYKQITSPVTVWNKYTQSYEAYSPQDDDYVFNPGEAFFIQADDVAQLTFIANFRQMHRADDFLYSRRAEAGATARTLFNLSLTDGQLTDKTRFVINEQASTGYERSCDAAKFDAMNGEMPQLYTLAQGTRYAINERPAADGIIELGFSVAKEGTYTLRLDNQAQNEVYLIDRLTGTEQLLTAEGYEFQSEAGTFNSRFSLRLGAGEVTGISNVTADKSTAPVYSVSGVRVDKAQKGLYIQQGKKVVVK